MTLNIKNASVERLAGELALLTGETMSQPAAPALSSTAQEIIETLA